MTRATGREREAGTRRRRATSGHRFFAGDEPGMLEQPLPVQRKGQGHEQGQWGIRDANRSGLFQPPVDALLLRECGRIGEQVEEHERAAGTKNPEGLGQRFGLVPELSHLVKRETAHDAIELPVEEREGRGRPGNEVDLVSDSGDASVLLAGALRVLPG